MKNYTDFIKKFSKYAAEKAIEWIVVGSYAMHVHAKRNDKQPPHETHDLDLLAILSAEQEKELRLWLNANNPENKLIFYWCDGNKQVDIWIERELNAIQYPIEDVVLGTNCWVVGIEQALKVSKFWSIETQKPEHPRHCDRFKHQETFNWYLSLKEINQ